MRKLQISARRLAVPAPTGRIRWAAWTRRMIARLGMHPRQASPVDMVWRRNPAPPAAGEPVRERSVTRVAPVVNLHLSVRPLVRNQWRERLVERAAAPASLVHRVERRTLVDRSSINRVENRTHERLLLAPREDPGKPSFNRAAVSASILARSEELPERRPRPNVAHAFDRLLVRRERVTHEETVERLMRRSRRVEETAAPPPTLALPKPTAPAQTPAAAQGEGTTARRKSNEAPTPPQSEIMPAQWAAALDPNRLADQVLREMDRRLVARKERFGRL